MASGKFKDDLLTIEFLVILLFDKLCIELILEGNYGSYKFLSG